MVEPRVTRLRRVLGGLDGTLRVLGALAGTLPLALLLAAALATGLPLPADVRFPLATLLVIPLWVSAMSLAFLTPRGWQLCLALAAAVALLAVLVPHAL